MKILAIVGSYRKRGNTARAVNLVIEEMQRLAQARNEPWESETLFLCDLNLSNCRGCRACFDRGEERCPLRDDLVTLRDKMLAADGIIAASPIYVDDVSGIMKTWIDRLAFLCHRPGLARQSVLLLTTVAGSPSSHSLRTLDLAFHTWGAHIAGKGNFKMGALLPEAGLDHLRPQAAFLAGKLFGAVIRREREIPSFYSLMMFRIQQLSWVKAPQGSIDQSYWQKQGWLDPGCEFYIPHRASRLKTILARWSGSLIQRLVT